MCSASGPKSVSISRWTGCRRNTRRSAVVVVCTCSTSLPQKAVTDESRLVGRAVGFCTWSAIVCSLWARRERSRTSAQRERSQAQNQEQTQSHHARWFLDEHPGGEKQGVFRDPRKPRSTPPCSLEVVTRAGSGRTRSSVTVVPTLKQALRDIPFTHCRGYVRIP